MKEEVIYRAEYPKPAPVWVIVFFSPLARPAIIGSVVLALVGAGIAQLIILLGG